MMHFSIGCSIIFANGIEERDHLFSRQSGLIVFRSNRPAQHVALYGPDGVALSFRSDASSFNDTAQAYAWAFQFDGDLAPGTRFVFASVEYAAAAEVTAAGDLRDVPVREHILRSAEGKPLAVASAFVSPVPKIVVLGLPLRAQGSVLRCMFVNPVIPYNQWNCYKAGVMNEASFSAHGAAYVSAALKLKGHTTWLIDFRSHQGWPHVEEVLRRQEYDVVFVGFLSIDAFHAAAAVRLLKELHPDRPVVVGGLHVSIAKERVFPRRELVDYYAWGRTDLLPGSFRQFLAYKGEADYIPDRYPLADYVILDDGEVAAQKVADDVAAGRWTPGSAPQTLEGGAVSMEVARHMDRDLFRLDFEAYSPILPFQPMPMATVTWARGCSYRCTYCNLSSQLSNTNVRTKSVALVEEELDDLHRRLGGRIGSLMIHDDLTFHIRHIAEWAELILRKWGPIPIWMQTRASMINAWYDHHRDLLELLCRAGLVYVSVGYESGSNRVLEYMRKDCTVEENLRCGAILDEYGINSFGNFLWGVPTETNDEADQTVDLVKKIRPGFLSGSIYCSYPGTVQDRECRENGLLVPGEVYTTSHLPWQYKVKGIDYAHRYACLSRAGQYANYLRMPKLLSPERQRELVACSRGLVIHAAGVTPS